MNDFKSPWLNFNYSIFYRQPLQWTLFTLCMGHLRVPNQEEVVLEAAWNNSMFRSFFAFFSQVYPYFSNDDKTV